MLLLDDVHALHGREATQEELLRSLEQLEERGVPVAVALAKPPERCTGLIEPLRKRLARLEQLEVRPPEWETRLAIVLARTRSWGVEPKPAVAELLASRLRGNLAQLDVLLTRLLTQSSCSHALDDIGAVKHLLSHASDPLIRVTPEDVLNAVAQQFNVRPRDLRSSSRSPRITTPRQIAMYLVRRHCGLSYPEIGRRFAKHHTTALHSDRVVQQPARREREPARGRAAGREGADAALGRRWMSGGELAPAGRVPPIVHGSSDEDPDSRRWRKARVRAGAAGVFQISTALPPTPSQLALRSEEEVGGR